MTSKISDKYRYSWFFLFLIILSCSKDKVHITLLETNFSLNQEFSFEYQEAYKNGFVIPNKKKDGISSLRFSFKVDNFYEDTLYYKLFYQNESYKFDDKNSLSHENFYGCSELTLTQFNKTALKQGNSFIVTDSIIIRGNPRNEKRYFGNNSRSFNSLNDTVGLASAIKTIKADSAWYKNVIQKAEINKIDLIRQLKKDALWALKKRKKSSQVNNRWKRNPRVGKYSILLVIAKRTSAGITPVFASNTTTMSPNGYVNPYYYFMHKKKKLYPTFLLDTFINIKAQVPIQNGIYVPSNQSYNKNFYTKFIGESSYLYRNAGFQIHETSLHNKVVKNIPLRSPFISGNYTKKEYYENIKKYDNQRIDVFFSNTKSPGKTIGIDTLGGTLWFKNPSSKNEYKKENIGFKTRHGLTYGKYTFKIKMASLLTKDNVWTGLTNALWLVKESDEKWNNRRICKEEGFMPFYGAGKDEKRVPQISYSEIDFEILKTSEYWPGTSYQDKKEREDSKSNDDKIMVTCTNWDMACKQPKNFGTGVQKINYNDHEYYPHRWDDFYNALTAKKPESDKELFNGDFYYFQIEWKPTEIIWRIGPSKDKLRVVCYMNDEITTIPNNQMIAVITQEYHFADWWPKSPYKQENIPFSSEDLNGRLYSLEIE